MARPRKMSTDEMLNIVNDCYEESGDILRLKYSLLEEYALSRGLQIKAYDFRRNAAVRTRIEELRDLSLLSAETGVIVYKNLDVEALINTHRSRDALKKSLRELDEMWRRIYDRALKLSRKNEALTRDISQKAIECQNLKRNYEDLSSRMRALKREHKDVCLENRYLRKMINSYLYPAIANEILKNENVLEQIDTEVTQAAMDKLTDPDIPAAFSSSVLQDREIIAREESLLNRMWAKVQDGGGNA